MAGEVAGATATPRRADFSKPSLEPTRGVEKEAKTTPIPGVEQLLLPDKSLEEKLQEHLSIYLGADLKQLEKVWGEITADGKITLKELRKYFGKIDGDFFKYVMGNGTGEEAIRLTEEWEKRLAWGLEQLAIRVGTTEDSYLYLRDPQQRKEAIAREAERLRKDGSIDYQMVDHEVGSLLGDVLSGKYPPGGTNYFLKDGKRPELSLKFEGMRKYALELEGRGRDLFVFYVFSRALAESITPRSNGQPNPSLKKLFRKTGEWEKELKAGRNVEENQRRLNLFGEQVRAYVEGKIPSINPDQIEKGKWEEDSKDNENVQGNADSPPQEVSLFSLPPPSPGGMLWPLLKNFPTVGYQHNTLEQEVPPGEVHFFV